MSGGNVTGFDEQNAFNLGAASRANSGRKNPYSRSAETSLYAAWQAGWREEDALLNAAMERASA